MQSRNLLKLKNWMKKKISFRFHMSIILLSTFFLGLVTNFIMMRGLGILHPGARYPLTVVFSYAWFLLFIRIYIKNILLNSSSNTNVVDYVDLPVDMHGGPGISIQPQPWTGGGGSFSGGGASGNWGAGGVVKEAAKESKADGISGLVDDEGAVILLLGALLFAAVFGSSVYLIWHSPEILSECLIQVILVSGLRRKMKKFSDLEWMFHIFKATYLSFTAILILSFLLGYYMRKSCPEANNLDDYRTKCMKMSI